MSSSKPISSLFVHLHCAYKKLKNYCKFVKDRISKSTFSQHNHVALTLSQLLKDDSNVRYPAVVFYV